MFSETRGLDPTIGSGSGTAGGTEMIALYDTITRWNPDTRKYDMRTADSLDVERRLERVDAEAEGRTSSSVTARRTTPKP